MLFGPTKVFLPARLTLSAVFENPSRSAPSCNKRECGSKFRLVNPSHLGMEDVKEEESEAGSRKLVSGEVQHQLLSTVLPPELVLQ